MADSKSEKLEESKEDGPVEKGTGSKVKFNKNIDVFLNKPLPLYDRNGIKAYQAEGRGKIPKNLIAFVCDNYVVPRWYTASTYVRIINPNIAHLIATGAGYIPSEKSERFMMIYENNWGQPFLDLSKKPAYGIKQDQIIEQFLPTIVGILKDFNEKGFVHGGIRVNNLFSGGSSGLKSFILGESLTTPASYLQPSLYEPIERSMADPIARGMGHFVDDVYSLGVLLTIMLRTNDPLRGLDERQILEQKIEKGSYAALTGKDRFTGPILELLRGILHDNKSQRWTIDEVLEWLDGQRLSPKQNLKRKKASRVFHLGGSSYTRPELLAHDLVENEEGLIQSVDDEKLELWIRRSLEDKEANERYELALASASDAGTGNSYPSRLASRVSIALDPPAPIRYKGLSFLPDGFGTALAKAFADKSDLNIFAEILDQGLVMFWLNAQSDKTIDYGSIATRFESCRSILRNKNAGFGLERCLYFLNNEAPCLSPKLESFYVKTPEEMVFAFESLCKDGKVPELMLDRHSVAFLSVKDSRILDSYLIELNAEEKYKNILGNIWAVSNIQKRYKMPPLPNLADHFVKILGPVLERFHDRHLRERMKKEFDKLKKSGDLSLVKAVLENPDIIETDTKMFFQAMTRYRNLEREKLKLERKLDTKGSIGKNVGRTFAAILSVVIGGIGIITLTLLELSGAGTGMF